LSHDAGGLEDGHAGGERVAREREDDSGRPWLGGGVRGAIRSRDMTLLGFLGADKIGRAAESLGDRVKRAIVVLNDTPRAARRMNRSTSGSARRLLTSPSTSRE
jgi:hypothetical protein